MPLPDFKNRSLLLRALTHRSYVNENSAVMEDNERLEFLGDAVLDFIVGAFLYHRYPDMDEGELTRVRAALVNNDMLAALAAEAGLGEQLRLGKGEADSGGRRRQTLLGAAFEAVLGAYYLDSGLDAVRAYVEPLFGEAAEHVILSEADVDAKSRFQEWAQSVHARTPRYEPVSVAGPDHNREYTVEVFVGDASFGSGSGPNKQAATQAAAREALRRAGLA
jgi:ribonuclease-3